MATKNRTATSLISTLLAAGIYKRNQGRLARQLTVLALWVLVFAGCYRLSTGPLGGYEAPIKLGIPVALGILGAWCAYRAANFPPFADFLVSVEAEMAKVSWPTRQEVWRATVVVIATMLLMALSLFVFDVIWQQIFMALGVIQRGGG